MTDRVACQRVWREARKFTVVHGRLSNGDHIVGRMSAGYPSPTTVFPNPRLRPPSAASAETLVLIALILQIIGGVLLTGGILFLFGWAAYHPFPFAWLALIVAGVVGGLAILFLYFAYTLSYLRIQRGDYMGAQTPTLVIGILSIFLGLIPGILYLVGYSKLSDAIREQQVPGDYLAPGGTPYSQTACRGCGKAYYTGQFPFCPNCGQKL